MPRQHIQVVSVVRNHLIEALLVLSESDKNDKRSDGLPSSIVSALSLATSGMGLTHSDIGGYTGLKTFGLNMNTMHWDDGTWLEKKLHPIAYSLCELTGSGLFGLVRTKELFLRWAEYSVFSPIMRTHEVCLTSSLQHFRFSFPTFKIIVNNRVSHQGNEPESFHQFYSDEDTMFQFGRLTQIFTTLKNYTKVASPFFSQF